MTSLFKIKLLHKDSQMPIKDNDKFVLRSYDSGTLGPGESMKIRTGIAMAFPNDYFAYIHALDEHLAIGLRTLAGVADSDYRGEYNVVLLNNGTDPFCFEKGDRIGVCHFIKILLPELIAVSDLDETERGEKGWGSTGKN